MKKTLLLLSSILISLSSIGDWKFHSSSLQGDTFHIHYDSIIKDEKYVYFWYLKSYIMPNKFGDFSSIVYVQGDCKFNRIKYLTYIYYKEPMGKGLGERADDESDWEYPTVESVGVDLLRDACNKIG